MNRQKRISPRRYRREEAISRIRDIKQMREDGMAVPEIKKALGV